MISVVKVDVSDNLKDAKIYISFFDNNTNGSDCLNKYLKIIKENKNLIKYKLGLQLNTKYVPEIQFILSNEFEYYDNINKHFNK